MNTVSLSRLATPGIVADIREGLRQATAAARNSIQNFSRKSFGTTKFFTNFAVLNFIENPLNPEGAGQTPGHTTGLFCARTYKATTAVISKSSDCTLWGESQWSLATGYDSRFPVSNAKLQTMNSVSLSRSAAPEIAASIKTMWARSRAKLSKAAAPLAFAGPALTFLAVLAEAEATASALAILSLAAIGLANHKTESTKITKTLKNA